MRMQSCRLGGALHTILWDAEPGAIRRDTDTVRAFGQVRGRRLVHAVSPFCSVRYVPCRRSKPPDARSHPFVLAPETYNVRSASSGGMCRSLRHGRMGSKSAVGGQNNSRIAAFVCGASAPLFCTYQIKLRGENRHESTHYVNEHRAPELGRLRIPSG